MIEAPSTAAVANWFGSSRMVADRIGPELGKLPLVVVPFAGGMSELPYINAAKLIVNDRHRHVVNLAAVMADPILGPKLYRGLRRFVFSPYNLRVAQQWCADVDALGDGRGLEELGLFVRPDARALQIPSLPWAFNYAVATWMGRGGNSGTRGEFRGKLPVRYSPNGGGSAQRFAGWVASIPAWRRVLRRCEFTTDDAFDVLEQAHDDPKCGLYCDSPWPDAGDGYRHPFDTDAQRRLARKLSTFTRARVVVRFADHPLIRELYPADRWTWMTYPSRAQTNGSFAEVLLINGPSYLTGRAA